MKSYIPRRHQCTCTFTDGLDASVRIAGIDGHGTNHDSARPTGVGDAVDIGRIMKRDDPTRTNCDARFRRPLARTQHEVPRPIEIHDDGDPIDIRPVTETIHVRCHIATDLPPREHRKRIHHPRQHLVHHHRLGHRLPWSSRPPEQSNRPLNRQHHHQPWSSDPLHLVIIQGPSLTH